MSGSSPVGYLAGMPKNKETAMFKNVLVGVDGRAGGHDAVALAARLTDKDGRLTLAHVHGDAMIGGAREESTSLLERERGGVELACELVSVDASSPGRGLHQQAEEQGADLLVVGSCARGALGRAMLGDDTRAALNGAPCAVAIASLGYAERAAPLAEIGVGYDESPESRAALEIARGLAAPTDASIHALEVIAIPTYAYTGIIPPITGESVELMLQEASTRMKRLPGVQGRAAYGLTGEELASFGEELDLLVVGSRGYGPAKRLVLGSTSNYLERHARCSLLVLPRTAAGADRSGDGRHEGETVAAAN
jgi:nucleotide-binding universal stress UspA family protein